MSWYYNNHNGCGCSRSNNSNSCGNRSSCNNSYSTTTGNGCQHRPPFPPMGAVSGTCPPGTRPCHCNYPPCQSWCGCGNGCGNNNCGCNNGSNNCGCGNSNNCGCGGNNGCGCGGNNGNNGCGCDGSNGGTYAFFNSTGSTLTTGSIIPLRYVIGSGNLGRGTTGGTVNLDAGVYSVEYSLNATADLAGATITVTPEYLGALHPEYSRSFTTSTAGQTFDIAGSFVVNLPTATTLSLNVTITGDGTTETVTLTGVNASMLIRRITNNCNA